MPAQLTRVVLTEDERRIVRWIGLRRQQGNSDGGVVDQQRAKDVDGARLNIIGFGAELAFCKLFNVYSDFIIGPRRGGADAVRFGDTVDVKMRRRSNGRLLVGAKKKELAADYYALFVVTEHARRYDDWRDVPPVYLFVGFAHAADVFRDEHLTDAGGGPVYGLDQSELNAEQR